MASPSTQKIPYEWTQTLDSVDVTIVLPKGTKAKELAVSITRSQLKVAFRDKAKFVEVQGSEDSLEEKRVVLLFQGATGSRGDGVVVDDALFADIRADDSTWAIEGNELSIHLDKVNAQQWWPHVTLGDPQIDTAAIQPEKSNLNDLVGETRAMVEKMMFDQRQKAQGKPSSDELRKEEALRKFKEMHPEMDFSNAELI